MIDETGLSGIYGLELKERVNTPEALIQLLRDEAGLVITRERREIPTLIVRQTEAEHESQRGSASDHRGSASLGGIA